MHILHVAPAAAGGDKFGLHGGLQAGCIQICMRMNEKHYEWKAPLT